jgi:hypothetical protein
MSGPVVVLNGQAVIDGELYGRRVNRKASLHESHRFDLI